MTQNDLEEPAQMYLNWLPGESIKKMNSGRQMEHGAGTNMTLRLHMLPDKPGGTVFL